MLRGLATVTLTATDVSAAARWYADLLEVEPYFARPVEGPPAYVEFRVGDDEDELGVMDARYAAWAAGQPTGAVVHWHVDDLPAAIERLTARGATVLQPLTERGEGFATAVVADPFGNLLGVMRNPHWLAAHGS
ncbi:VOC family protein [Geodermatophilus maliterrae]|uniref:VOC family protein n=1 Tax=Geodermatophilus maliterrae TaxID=3162531 RepID=A0ABV3XHU4_9ACTN